MCFLFFVSLTRVTDYVGEEGLLVVYRMKIFLSDL